MVHKPKLLMARIHINIRTHHLLLMIWFSDSSTLNSNRKKNSCCDRYEQGWFCCCFSQPTWLKINCICFSNSLYAHRLLRRQRKHWKYIPSVQYKSPNKQVEKLKRPAKMAYDVISKKKKRPSCLNLNILFSANLPKGLISWKISHKVSQKLMVINFILGSKWVSEGPRE